MNIYPQNLCDDAIIEHIFRYLFRILNFFPTGCGPFPNLLISSFVSLCYQSTLSIAVYFLFSTQVRIFFDLQEAAFSQSGNAELW